MSCRVNNPDFLVNFWPFVGGRVEPVIRADSMNEVGTVPWDENPFGHSSPDVNGSNTGYYGTEISLYQYTNFSYGCWFTHPDGVTGPDTVMNFGSTNGPSPPQVQTVIMTDSGGSLEVRSCDGTTRNDLDSGYSPNDGQIHHVMAVFHTGHIIMYIDGEYKNSMSRTMSGSPIGDHPVGFGVYGNGSTVHPWEGQFWAGRFYNIPLSGEEVKYIYDRKI